MSNGIFALAPNRMGHFFSNRGMETITSNRGYGVEFLKPKPIDEKNAKTNSPTMNSLRVAKARQFGRKKTEVGF